MFFILRLIRCLLSYLNNKKLIVDIRFLLYSYVQTNTFYVYETFDKCNCTFIFYIVKNKTFI